LALRKPRNGYFLRAESFFNVPSFVDSQDIFSPDLSLTRGFLQAPDRFLRAVLEDD
jgi:hypothetical protein